jgi:opacity protein-like surface antigen
MTVKTLTIFFSAAAILAGSFASEAQSREDGGYYISGFGGLAFQSGNTNTPANANGISSNLELDYDTGYSLGGSIGYKLPVSSIFSGFRIELEAAYREGDVNPTDDTDRLGDTSSFGVLANVLYDFDEIASDFFVPYIGLGAGLAGVESDVFVDFPDATGTFVTQQFGGATRTQFVYQGIVGATFPISDSFDLFIDGRYYSAGGVEFDLVAPDSSETAFDSDYDVVQVQAGFRFHF